MNILVEKLWPELKVYKGRLVYVLLLGIFVSAFKGAIPELINRLIKSWENQDQQLAYMIPAAISIVWILSGVFRFFHLYWMKYISDLVAVKLKKDLIDKYLSLNLGFLDNFSH